MYEIVTFLQKNARKSSNFKVWGTYVHDYLKIIYDEIEMLSLKGIELLFKRTTDFSTCYENCFQSVELPKNFSGSSTDLGYVM